MKWNGLQGIVETVNEVSLQCLVRFIVDGLEQAHYTKSGLSTPFIVKDNLL
jgi:hypothetical protein